MPLRSARYQLSSRASVKSPRLPAQHMRSLEKAEHRRYIQMRSTSTDEERADRSQQTSEPTLVSTITPTPPNKSTSWQIILALCTVAIFICYADRSNISVAVISMSEQFQWSESLKGTILSVFFLGYAGTQLVGGSLADRYGGKSVLLSGVIAWSVFTFFTPDAAMLGTSTLIACRIAMGLGEGIAFPAVHSIISSTMPREIQSTAVAVVTAASYAGAGAAAGLTPWIIDHYSWPMAFYTFGASAVLWLPAWQAVDVPHRRKVLPPAADDSAAAESASLLSNGESTSAGESRALFGMDAGFLQLLKRKEVWAICITQYCQSWGMLALLNWLPTYFKEVHVDLSNLGSYTVVPAIAQAAIGAFAGVTADRLISRGWSVRNTRLSLQIVGMLGPAGCLLLAISPLAEDSAATASALITVGQGLSALTLGAVSVSQLDIAPRHAGSVFGLGNTFGTASGLLSVQLTGNILDVTQSWPLVFTVTSLHYVVGAAVWFFWAGGEPLKEDSIV